MTRIYLDNAATTSLLPEILDAMLPYYKQQFGNPSTQYSYGREARSAVEGARKSISGLLNASPGEIIFTSGGTESNNMALFGAIRDMGIKRLITAETEHHCVLHTASALQAYHGTHVVYLPVDSSGKISLSQLEELLQDQSLPTIVSLMHANNETGTLLDMELTGNLCRQYGALFHSDTVQTFAHYALDTRQLPVDFLSGSAHKFHGPKGTGFLFVKKGRAIGPLLKGGGQERGLRAGTENVAGIAGLAKAAEVAYAGLAADSEYIRGLKKMFYDKLILAVPGAVINGPEISEGLYTVLNMSFPAGSSGGLSLFALDLEGLCVSGGSACSSGANAGSHVLEALGVDENRINIRFSFSKLNTVSEIEQAVSILQKVLVKN